MTETIVDYAYPTMMAEKALKELHDAMLRKDYEAAAAASKEAMMQLFDAQYAIFHEKHKEETRRVAV